MKTLLYTLFLLWVFCSCTEPSRLETALLQSGANRPELEKVLSHYKDEPLKYRAACFLIEHMPGKYSLEPESEDDPYRNFLRHILPRIPSTGNWTVAMWGICWTRWHGWLCPVPEK